MVDLMNGQRMAMRIAIEQRVDYLQSIGSSPGADPVLRELRIIADRLAEEHFLSRIGDSK